MPAGNSNVFLQPRDRSLLRHLAERRLLDRDQIARLAGFASVSRVNVRLIKLRQAELITRYFIGTRTGSRRSVYAVTRKGASAISAEYTAPKWRPDSTLTGNSFAIHQLACNDIYLVATGGRTDLTWTTFGEPASKTINFRPDALIEQFEKGAARSMFLEVDLGTEPLPRWTKKAGVYIRLALSGAYKRLVQADTFAVLVVVEPDHRLRSLREHIAKQTPRLFWFATLDEIKQRGFWSPIWLRPTGDQRFPPGA